MLGIDTVPGGELPRAPLTILYSSTNRLSRCGAGSHHHVWRGLPKERSWRCFPDRLKALLVDSVKGQDIWALRQSSTPRSPPLESRRPAEGARLLGLVYGASDHSWRVRWGNKRRAR